MQKLFHTVHMSCRLLLMFAILGISGCYGSPELELTYVDPELCKRNIVSVGERVVGYKLNRFSPTVSGINIEQAVSMVDTEIVYKGMVVVGQSRLHPLRISKDSKTIKFSIDKNVDLLRYGLTETELIFNLDNLNREGQWPDYNMRKANHDFIDENGDINIWLRWVYVVIHSVSSDRLEYTLKLVQSTSFSDAPGTFWRPRGGPSVFRVSPIPCPDAATIAASGLVPGVPEKLVKCAASRGLLDDTIIYEYQSGEHVVIGPGGWKVTLALSEPGVTRLVAHRADGTHDADRTRIFEKALRNCGR